MVEKRKFDDRALESGLTFALTGHCLLLGLVAKVPFKMKSAIDIPLFSWLDLVGIFLWPHPRFLEGL